MLNFDHYRTYEVPISITVAMLLAIWNYILSRKIEKLKNDGQKQIHIHKTQFDKEFAIYQTVWQKIVELKEAVYHLRPRVRFGVAGKSLEELTIDNIQKATIICNELILLTEENKPFYEQKVYDELSKIVNLVKKEIIEVNYGDKSKTKYWEDGKETLDSIITYSDRICETIRRRVTSVNTENHI